jgi:hypothetical protein
MISRSILLLALTLGSLAVADGQALDISSGGAPTITGSVGGSVTGSSSVVNDLLVTINFGELSPANPNNNVKVTVPIAVRSHGPYQVTVTYSGTTSANPLALQRSDIGFGINNWRPIGSQARVCNNSPHIIYSPFNNDPSSNITLSASGRAQYVSDLSDVTISTTILSGPRLSNNNNNTRQPNDGYIFDAVFVVTPQFYAAGTTSATLIFTISTGPNVPC